MAASELPAPEGAPVESPDTDQDPVEVRVKVVLGCILQHHGGYESEPQLLQWLNADGAEIGAAELVQVLDRLWETGEVIRPPVNAGSPRPGWIGHGRDEEGWLVSASGVRIFLRGGASAPL